MITIEDLTVKVTYTVGLGNVEMPEEIYEQLLKAADEGKSLDPTDTRFYPEAANWLANNIRERDCMGWSAEIDEISEQE